MVVKEEGSLQEAPARWESKWTEPKLQQGIQETDPNNQKQTKKSNKIIMRVDEGAPHKLADESYSLGASPSHAPSCCSSQIIFKN